MYRFFVIIKDKPDKDFQFVISEEKVLDLKIILEG